MKLDEITQKNYYDDKTQLAFLSKTVFSNFTECEAQGVAIMKKQYSKFANDIALIHGNYVHSYFESEDAHKAFIDNEHNHTVLYTKAGSKTADTKRMDDCIKALESNKDFKKYYLADGAEKEKIVTGQLYTTNWGNIFDTDTKLKPIDWFGKLDSVSTSNNCICDIKTSANFYKVFNHGGVKNNFIAEYGYDIQLAIYQELYRQMTGKTMDMIIFAVSKQTAIVQPIKLPQSRLNDCLEYVKDKQERVDLLLREMRGHKKTTAQACGLCPYWGWICFF